MAAAACVGRVGSLAVALGIGAAMATGGLGVARADGGDSTASSHASGTAQSGRRGIRPLPGRPASPDSGPRRPRSRKVLLSSLIPARR
jgi:hypothetical protein